MKDVVSEFTEVQSRCVLAEGKVKQLEQKLQQKDEAYDIVAKVNGPTLVGLSLILKYPRSGSVLRRNGRRDSVA